MKLRFALLLFVALSFSMTAQAIVYEPLNPPERVQSEAKVAEVHEFEGVTFYSMPDDRLQYYVTTPSNPAHPFIVEVKILGGRTDTRFEATGYGKNPESQAAQDLLQKVNDSNNSRVKKLEAIEAEGGK